METEKKEKYRKIPEHKILKAQGKSHGTVIKNRYKTPRGFGNSKTTLKTGK